jgi:hypothetical protein
MQADLNVGCARNPDLKTSPKFADEARMLKIRVGATVALLMEQDKNPVLQRNASGGGAMSHTSLSH